MMENDILFGRLDMSEVLKNRSLETAYSFYHSAYNSLAENLADVISDNKVETDLDRMLQNVFTCRSTSKGEDLRILVYRYRDFLNQFIKFLNSNDHLYRQLKQWGLEVDEIKKWREGTGNYAFLSLPRMSNFASLQFMVSSKCVVEKLTSLYKHFCYYGVVSSLGYEGCRLLSVTWIDFVCSIKSAAQGIFINPLCDALVEILKGGHVDYRVLATVFTPMEKTGAAFAEYPYGFINDGSVTIRPVEDYKHKLVPPVGNLYNVGKMQLDFQDACGMAVALFDYDVQGKSIHCLSFAGTRIGFKTPRKTLVAVENVVTDLFQFISLPSVVYFAAVGILEGVMKSYPNDEVYVFGHSLGGGLTQFSCAAVNSCRTKGYCYNSAGLGDFSVSTIMKKHGRGLLKCKIHHICSQHDPVSRFGKQLKEVKYIKSVSNIGAAHKLGQLNRELNGQELRVKHS